VGNLSSDYKPGVCEKLKYYRSLDKKYMYIIIMCVCLCLVPSSLRLQLLYVSVCVLVPSSRRL